MKEIYIPEIIPETRIPVDEADVHKVIIAKGASGQPLAFVTNSHQGFMLVFTDNSKYMGYTTLKHLMSAFPEYKFYQL